MQRQYDWFVRWGEIEGNNCDRSDGIELKKYTRDF